MPLRSLIRGRTLLFLAMLQLSGVTASLIAFGDSYSDAGQGANSVVQAALETTQVCSLSLIDLSGRCCMIMTLTRCDPLQQFPVSPYFEGRFSDGPIYVEVAAAALGDVLDSFAAGAAVTGAPGTVSNLAVYPPYDGISSVVDVAMPTGVQQVYMTAHNLCLPPRGKSRGKLSSLNESHL